MKSTNSLPNQDSIAIIGMSCRFPKSHSLTEFWDLLSSGKDTIAEIPAGRWDPNQYYDPDPLAERKTYQQHASLLSDIHDFDPLFFNISPVEAEQMSPSQKLMLELAWESIENSTLPFSDIKGTNVGVFVGSIWTDFEHYRKTKNAKATLHSSLGMSANVIANRVSFAMGFTGPSLVVDTGCSASLVALHLACQSLLNNETALSLVGGINHILDPDRYIDLTQFGGLSAKGRCSSFDADADGFVRGEGGSVVLLKKLSEAERDGNKIYAIIRGSAINNNGYNGTIAATSAESQKSLFEKVYRHAAIKPQEVHYVEAHGTGTKKGDPIEATAIGEFFSKGRNGNKLRIGSVKSNIGHTEATAGIAGLVKVVLAMQHKVLPPNPHFTKPNPNIPFEELQLEVQKDLSPWPVTNGETFKAGINSFGWGGTNAHVVLEEYRNGQEKISTTSPDASTQYCLPVSAKSTQALKDYARSYIKAIENGDEENLKKICMATALRQSGFDHNILFSADSVSQMLTNLERFIEDETDVMPYTPLTANPKVVFVFPGQGGQWLGMGSELLVKEKVFRDSILASEAAFRPFTDWVLTDQLMATPETSRLNEINVIQPAICAIQIALAKLWISWGIHPQAIVGHSMGEIAAAHISGALKLEDAARIICERSLLMKTVSGTGGVMLLTELSRAEAEKIAGSYNNKITVAVYNSPKSIVLAGDKHLIGEVSAQLEAKGLFCRFVKLDAASHSPQMDPLKEPLRARLQQIVPQKTTIPFLSTVYLKVMQGTDLNADYWVDNLREAVQFAPAMDKLLEEEHTIFIEVNPHPILVNAVIECAEHNDKKVITVASLQREKPEQEIIYKNLGVLYNKGYMVNWQHFYGINQVPDVLLPSYPFQREPYEIEDLSEHPDAAKEITAKYPLLGNKINLAGNADTYYWKSIISLDKFPWLREHLLLGRIVVPVSCYIELIIEAFSEVANQECLCISELSFFSDITLFGNGYTEIQVKLAVDENKIGHVSIFKKEDNGSEWIQVSQGSVSINTEQSSTSEIAKQTEYHAPAFSSGVGYYNLLRSVGLHYGSQFQLVTGFHKTEEQTLPILSFSIKADHRIHLSASKYKVHPVVMNSFFHPLYGQLLGILEEGMLLDLKFDSIARVTQHTAVNYSDDLRGVLVFYPLTPHENSPGTWHFEADITIVNDDGTCVMSLAGVKGIAVGKTPEASSGVTDEDASFLENYAAIKTESEKQLAIEQLITDHVATVIRISPKRIKNTMTFKGLGVDSLMSIQLRNLLEKDLLIKLPVGIFWSHPDIQAYSSYVKGELTAESDSRTQNDLRLKDNSNNWFTIPKPNPNAQFRVFCFHDAGGSTSLFDNWENLLDGSLTELVLVEMPGRARRMEEAPCLELKHFLLDIIPAMTGLLDKPYLFLGHSMGGVLAFEATRELRRKKMPLPQALFLSSVPEMSVYENKKVDFNTLSNDELVLMYPHLNKIKDAEIRNLFITILRADLQFLYDYDFVREEPLDIPIIAIHATSDERVKRNQMEKWEAQTTAAFKFISREGGHRYIEHDSAFVSQLLQEKIYSETMQRVKPQI